MIARTSYRVRSSSNAGSGRPGGRRRPVASRRRGRHWARSLLWVELQERQVVDDCQQVGRPLGVQELCADRDAPGLGPVELVDGHARGYPGAALIQVHTLTDGGQTSLDVARKIAAFVDGARETLELALYDIRLHDETARRREERARRRARARRPRPARLQRRRRRRRSARPVPVPPPPKTEPILIESLPFETAAVPGWPDLMHHKYVVRDRDAVWSGSTNWTDDSWTREENVIVVVESTGVAIRFQDDFAQLWKKRKVSASGKVRDGSDPRRRRAGADVVLAETRREARASDRRPDRRRRAPRSRCVAGDHVGADPRNARRGRRGREGRPGRRRRTRRRSHEVLGQWRANGNVTWKMPSLKFLLDRATFSGKRSTPYAPGRGARLHAREGDGRRRHGVHRQLQPVAFRRDERRERARDRGSRRWPSAWPASSTRFARSIRR